MILLIVIGKGPDCWEIKVLLIVRGNDSPLRFTRNDSFPMCVTERRANFLTVEEHLISIHLDPPQPRLSPFYDELISAYRLGEDLGSIRSACRQDLDLLGIMKGILFVVRFHAYVIYTSVKVASY